MKSLLFILALLLTSSCFGQAKSQAARRHNLIGKGTATAAGVTMVRANHLAETKPDTSGTLSVTFTGFTPQNDSIVVLMITMTTTSGDPGTGTTISGYTRLQTVAAQQSGGGYWCRAECWYKLISGAAGTETITVVNPASVSDALVYMHASSLTMANATQNGGTITNAALGASGTGAMTLSAAPSSSDVTVASRHFFESGSTDPTATPGSGWFESFDTTGTGGYGGFETQWRSNSTSTAVAWTEINDIGATVVKDIGLAVVIKSQ